MFKKSIIGLSVILLLSVAVFGQKVYTPEKSSVERKTILDALRVPIEKQLKQKIQFSIENFKVSGNWAFINGSPQNMNGNAPDYKETVFQEAIANGAFDNNFSALLKKTGGKWKVVTHAIGCTDVCYATWWKDYKTPKAIFPYTE